MTVIVGIDGSAASIEALWFAAREAKLRQAPLRIVHTYVMPVTGSWTSGAVIDPEPFRENAERIVDQAVTDLGDEVAGLEVERVVEAGSAVSGLLEQAKADDLVVVGSRGHGGFTGLLLGSVSQQIVLHAPCPVVVVRGGGH